MPANTDEELLVVWGHCCTPETPSKVVFDAEKSWGKYLGTSLVPRKLSSYQGIKTSTNF